MISFFLRSIMGHEKIVEFLLENGADVNAVASSDVSAMWLAASEGRVEVMKLLAKNNAEASNTRVDGISTLMTAAVSKYFNFRFISHNAFFESICLQFLDVLFILPSFR